MEGDDGNAAAGLQMCYRCAESRFQNPQLVIDLNADSLKNPLGRMTACRGTLASMDAETFESWDKAHREFLGTCPETFKVRHIVYISHFTME